VLLCLALAALERSERQTTLGRLAETMLGFFAADPGLTVSGQTFDLKSVGSTARPGAGDSVFV